MINNYEVNFKIKELIAAFFGFGEKNLDFFRKMNYLYELSSGRDSIYFILKDIEKKKGKGEVICPNYSCKAIPRAIIAAGFKPVFVDLDSEMSLEITEVKKAINENTKAIIFYHPWGFLHSRKIVDFSKKNNIFLIEDCAQIIGEDVGTWGDYSFFSFRTSKIIGVGTGAIVLSKQEISIPVKKNKKLIGLMDLLDLIFRIKIKNYSRPRAIIEKFEGIKNRKMGNFHKILLTKEIKKLEKNIGKRILNYETIKKIINKTKNFKNIEFTKAVSPLYFPILCEKKETAIKLFKKNGINATGYYNFINSECFNSPGFGNKNSKTFSLKLINLPIHDKLSENEIEKIKDSILEIDKELI